MAPTRTSEKDSSEAQAGQRKKPGRAPVSCAECRRLKLRCDRKVPCETCTKRGCAALCPDGSLPTTKGPKKAAADVDRLKKRVEQLEAALQALQMAVSDEPHPLLRGDSTPADSTDESSSANAVASSSSNGTGSADSPAEEEQDAETDLLDSFGTLTLGTRGEARYFGQTSRAEYLIHAPERLAAYDSPKLPRLSQFAVDEANTELDYFATKDEVGEEIVVCLPSINKAIHLCEIFFAYSKFLWYPVPRTYIMDEVIPGLYHPTDAGYCYVTKKHGVSLLFMIFALATLFDLDMPPYAAEAHEYYLIARLALRWAPPAYDTTLASIQSMIYMAMYLEMSDCEPAHSGSHKAWMQIRQAVSLGESIGLHVSSKKWQLDHTDTVKRGRIFWQLAKFDAWLSFGFGRPPSISLAFVDCELPKEEDAFVNEEDEGEAGYYLWTWQFTKVLHLVMTSAFGAKSPTYAKILELDRRVRDSPLPSKLRVACGATEENPPPSVSLTMQRMFVTLWKESTLLSLHRPYFSLAVKEASDNPLKHRYAPSVLAVYRSAWRILSAVQAAYRIAPIIVSRCGFVWSYALTCSILLCLLITRAPASTLAAPSLVELNSICTLFEEATTQSQVASNNLEVIRKLRAQAHSAMSNVQAEDAAAVAAELDRLGGKTQLIQTMGQRMIHCHSKAKFTPNPPLSVFEVTNACGAYIRPTVAHSHAQGYGYPVVSGTSGVQQGKTPPQAVGYGDEAVAAQAAAAGGAADASVLAGIGNGQFQMDFPTGICPELAQADISAILNFDMSSGVWDPAFAQSMDGVDVLQPNAADAEATWQSLVEQLGI
ncbi:hypothetical protein C8Q73DRAFT_787911 [Cubamyces lactineus]|nr:hypothetical protein C8Q73DRAFT_787911 [Cubamyces lactineus]